jgi:hypothetical protein
MRLFINKYCKIIGLQCKISSEMQYYSGQIGIIKGTKKLSDCTPIYLIEFLDYSRIWTTPKEFHFF